MHGLHCVSRAVVILAVALTSAPAVAQSRPDSLDLPMAAQVRDPVDGSRAATFAERLGFAAVFTAVGAGVGYSWWHSCNDPESEAIWSCIVAPRRLGTSVRVGAYTGLAVGLIGLVGNVKVAERQNLVRAAGPSLLVDHHARSGVRVGVSFRF